jgi:hypothetical protein
MNPSSGFGATFRTKGSLLQRIQWGQTAFRSDTRLNELREEISCVVALKVAGSLDFRERPDDYSREPRHLTNSCRQSVPVFRRQPVHLTQQPVTRFWDRGLFDTVLSYCRVSSEGSPASLQLLAPVPLGS